MAEVQIAFWATERNRTLTAWWVSGKKGNSNDRLSQGEKKYTGNKDVAPYRWSISGKSLKRIYDIP